MTDTPSKLSAPHNTALKLLAQRDHSELELSQKLRAKGYTANDVQTVLETLTQQDLLSNARFTASYIIYRRNKGYGPVRIHSGLSARGIPEDMIEHHLNFTDNAWLKEARRAWQKRFKNQVPSDPKIRAKQMRFLQSRGFTLEQINHIFDGDIEHG
jgi:regulatory protein